MMKEEMAIGRIIPVEDLWMAVLVVILAPLEQVPLPFSAATAGDLSAETLKLSGGSGRWGCFAAGMLPGIAPVPSLFGVGLSAVDSTSP